MLKSNINISSNIYIRSCRDIRKDKEYLQRITGAQRIRDLQNRFTGLESLTFSPVQESIASGNVICAYAKNGEMSYGPVMKEGRMHWINRCENETCPRYTSCTSVPGAQPIHREIRMDNASEEEREELREFFQRLGIQIQEDTVIFERDRNRSKLKDMEECEQTYTPPAEQPVTEVKEAGNQYQVITTPDCIIHAPLESHIILNSGPGTGKTYTIIQRLIYLLEQDMCSAEEIYILCYTRSAKKVVESKLEEAVAEGKIPPSASSICVLTFDSYATYFLMEMKEQGVLKEHFEGCDYNERIRLFNKYVSADDFSGIRYFIVDEIQDLVNERAKMVLTILKHLQCGYLLAGDRCQSIYDYEADQSATLDSVRFYQLAEQQFPPDMLRYEISINRRQTEDLAKESSAMRQILLNKDYGEQNHYANEVMKRYSGNTKVESYIKTLTETFSVPTAILCRNNGEAEYISSLLCERKIPHILNRGVNNAAPLPRWIADVFWDDCREIISKQDFLDRFRYRVQGGMDAERIWQSFLTMTHSQDPSAISLSRLTAALGVVNNIPSDFYEKAPLLTVSTIHKAKGSEFDRVVLIESAVEPSKESGEEARVRYVALTRPKTQFITMRKNTHYFKRTASGRVIETGLINPYQTKIKCCRCITVGLNGDVDQISFVAGDFESVLQAQEYLIQNVKLYDKLTAVRSAESGLYEVFHNEQHIGTLSKSMTNEIDLGISATDLHYRLPDKLENLYVSGISTELLRSFRQDVPIEYQKSRICYGIQITGLARLRFEKK